MDIFAEFMSNAIEQHKDNHKPASCLNSKQKAKRKKRKQMRKFSRRKK